MSNEIENRKRGKSFEALVLQRSKYNGLLAIKNPLSCQYIRGGSIQVIKSELDYKIITQDGKVGFFDCKCYNSNTFIFSKIDPRQLEKAKLYQDWNVPSGFLIYFEPSDQIVFFKASDLLDKGARSSFSANDGTLLGNMQNFDLRPILNQK